MKKLFIVVVILAASMVSLYGQQEPMLKIGVSGEPETLNIWKSSGPVTTNVIGWFYPRLYYRKPVTLELLPNVCTLSYSELKANSPDGLTYTLPLRTDVVWDDGTVLTAHDFELSYRIITELELPNFFSSYEIVDYIRAVDDYTLEIKLNKCNSFFEQDILVHFCVPGQQFGSILENALKTDAPAQTLMDTLIDHPVSAGPFSFAQWEKGSFVKLTTNPTYFGKGRKITIPGLGEREEGPHYDGILFYPYATMDSALLAIQTGEIDFIWEGLEPGHVSQLVGHSDITVEKGDTMGFYFLAPNLGEEPFTDLVFRQALVYLVQKDYMHERVIQEYGGIAHSVVMPAAGEWYNDTVNKFGYGMTREERVLKATEMLTAAGYTVPGVSYPDGVILLPDGTEMGAIEILTPPADYDPMRAMIGVLIQGWWREIGVPVSAKPVSFGELVSRAFENRDFDCYVLGWGIPGPFPDYIRQFFHSDQTVEYGYNSMDYINPTVDAALEEMMGSCDRSTAVAASHTVQELVVEEVAYIPLFFKSVNEAHRDDTFSGWFTQLNGISGATQSPTSCLLYVKPVTDAPESDEGGTCLGTVLLSGLVAAGCVICKRRR